MVLKVMTTLAMEQTHLALAISPLCTLPKVTAIAAMRQTCLVRGVVKGLSVFAEIV
jgi:hypothetical protein